MVFKLRALPASETSSKTSPSVCAHVIIEERKSLSELKVLLELVQLPGYEKRRVTNSPPAASNSVWQSHAPSPSKPALLLFDEPLSNLDVTLREEETRGEVARAGYRALA